MRMLKAIPAGVHALMLVVVIAVAGWTACLLPDIHALASSRTDTVQQADCAGPMRRVCVARGGAAGGCFQIDAHAVTNAQFRQFVAATDYQTTAEQKGFGDVYFAVGSKPEKVAGANWRQPFGLGAGIAPGENMPVVQVSWHDAVAYAGWSGKQLPTVHQWRAAADRPSVNGAKLPPRETQSQGDRNSFYPELSVAEAGRPTMDGVFGMKQPRGIREWCTTPADVVSNAQPICSCEIQDALRQETGNSDNLTGFRCVAPAYSP